MIAPPLGSTMRIGPFAVVVTEELPTTNSLRVARCVMEDGTTCVLKLTRRSDTMSSQVAQLRLLAVVAPERYPAVLWAGPERPSERETGPDAVLLSDAGCDVVLRGGVDACRDTALTARVVDALFEVISRGPTQETHVSAIADLAGRRAARLSASASSLQWLASDRTRDALRDLASRTASASSLAAHGDLAPRNVTVDDTGSIRFVDVRGDVRWFGDVPAWDPILDVAGYAAFALAVEPVLTGVDPRDRLGGDLDSVLEVVASSAPAATLLADDADWSARFAAEVVSRLVGNAGIRAASSSAHAGDIDALLAAADAALGWARGTGRVWW